MCAMIKNGQWGTTLLPENDSPVRWAFHATPGGGAYFAFNFLDPVYATGEQEFFVELSHREIDLLKGQINELHADSIPGSVDGRDQAGSRPAG